MKLLSISTSTPRGSTAILDGDRVLSASAYTDQRGHAERLFGAIDEVLGASGLARSSIEAVACDVGPGSFTGVRVGIASAKGIALALGLRATGVLSLEAMAAAAFGDGRAGASDVIAAVLDAKKGELFLGAFDSTLAPILSPRHLPYESASSVLLQLADERRVILLGELTDELAALGKRGRYLLLADSPRPVAMDSSSPDLPDAVWVGRVAAARLTDLTRPAHAPPGAHATQRGHEAADLEAVYVRAPDAKLPSLG